MIYFLSFALPFLFLAFLFSQPWSSELFFELGDGTVEEEFKLEIQILPAFWNHWDLLHCHWLKDINSIIGGRDRPIHINLSLCRKSTRDKVNNLEDIVWKKFTQSAPTSSDSQVERLVSWIQDLWEILKILVSSGLGGLLLHSDWQNRTNPLWKWRSACSNSVRWKRASAFARVIPMWSAWNLKCETNKKPFKFAWNCFFLTKAHLRTTWASSNDLVHRVSRP